MGVILERKKRILLNEPHLVTTAPAEVANFSTDLIAPLKSCKVEFSPLQSGTGDPSPENVRPISGWTGCKITRCGKNLFNVFTTGYYSPSSGKWVASNLDVISKPIKLSAGTHIMLSQLDNTKSFSFEEWKDIPRSTSDMIPSNLLARSSNSTGGLRAYTVQNDCYLSARVGISEDYSYNTFNNQQVQLELGETATPYEPYTGSTIPIDWTTEAGTVYGGYVDPVSGELVATSVSESFDLTGRSYTTDNGLDSWIIDAQYASTAASSSNGKMCDKAKYSYGGAGVGNSHFYITSQGRIVLYLPEEQHRTDTVQFVYPLATPITYQLTPTQLKSLRGVNNIWSDANGDTTVKFWTH